MATLLIPSQQLRLLERACAGSGISALLGKLVAYALVPAQISSSILRTTYQPDGLNLIRRSFRVSARTWFLLGQLARLHGVSRCRMFMILLITWSHQVSKLLRRKQAAGQWILREFLSLQALAVTRMAELIWKPAPDS